MLRRRSGVSSASSPPVWVTSLRSVAWPRASRSIFDATSSAHTASRGLNGMESCASRVSDWIARDWIRLACCTWRLAISAISSMVAFVLACSRWASQAATRSTQRCWLLHRPIRVALLPNWTATSRMLRLATGMSR